MVVILFILVHQRDLKLAKKLACQSVEMFAKLCGNLAQGSWRKKTGCRKFCIHFYRINIACSIAKPNFSLGYVISPRRQSDHFYPCEGRSAAQGACVVEGSLGIIPVS